MAKKNFAVLIKEELESRFESVLVNEINQYKKEKKFTDDKIDALQSDINSLRQELKASICNMGQAYSHVLKVVLDEKNQLESDFDFQRRHIRTSSDKIKEHIKDSEETLSQFIDRETFYEFVSHVNMSISKINTDRDKDKNTTFEALHDIEFKVKNAYHTDMVHHAIHIDNMMKTISDFNDKIEEYRVNNDGFVRDLLVYKKTISIIEKKIENLYTLVERAKK